MKPFNIFVFCCSFFSCNSFSESITDRDYYHKIYEDLIALKVVSANGANYQKLEDYQKILLLRKDFEKIESIKGGVSFYYEGSDTQRALFKKCKISSVYTFANFYKNTLSELESCVVENCERKKALFAGVVAAAGTLEKEIDFCSSELKPIIQ